MLIYFKNQWKKGILSAKFRTFSIARNWLFHTSIKTTQENCCSLELSPFDDMATAHFPCFVVCHFYPTYSAFSTTHSFSVVLVLFIQALPSARNAFLNHPANFVTQFNGHLLQGAFPDSHLQLSLLLCDVGKLLGGRTLQGTPHRLAV